MKTKKKGFHRKIYEKTIHEYWVDDHYFGVVGPELHSSGTEPVTFVGTQSSLWGAHFLFGGHGPEMSPRGAGPDRTVIGTGMLLTHLFLIRFTANTFFHQLHYWRTNDVLAHQILLLFQNNEGLIVARTNTLIIVAIYTEKMFPSVCVEAVEKLADYFREKGR